MKYFLRSLAAIGIVMLATIVAEAQLNLPLKKQLDSIYRTDQLYRDYLSSIENGTVMDSLSTAFRVTKEDLPALLWTKQNEIDRNNLSLVERLFSKYGYPGKTLVGTPTNEAAWFVIQHSPAIETYYPRIRQAGRQNEIPWYLVAMMQDRLLSQQGKPQLYGTQVLCYPPKEKPDHAECFVWLVKKPMGVNKRRRKAGFPNSVEENATQLGVHYKVLTRRQVKKLYETPQE
ncbi:DUF6624 domain-containing protein [Spirosoma rigui]|uniref:DUF6624 domain-containing protein n=1 Tax=Spirosoma rigui TaxID=564064 RepID=UPI0009B0ECE0|nr:DUF6624 domain-containing protein [Spirosoma rigui]